MTFRKLSIYLENLEKTSSRIEITKILADLFNKTSEDEIDKVVYLLLGGLAPTYRQTVFNVAEKMMIQAVAKAYQKNLAEVNKLYKTKGDLGDVAFTFAKVKRTKSNLPAGKAGVRSLGVSDIYSKLLKIAQEEGEGSVDRKIEGLAKLLREIDPQSVKFVSRVPIGKLRLGFSDKTIIDALSWMRRGDKSAKSELEKAYFVLPDVGLLAKKVKKKGVREASLNIQPKIGVPLLPMLPQRLKSPSEMIEKMTKVSVEPKFDGLRIQIHFKAGKGGFVKAFTRNLNESSWMFPELKSISNQIKAKELILDTEAVGVDENTKKMANFQKTMTRRRKYNIENTSKNVGIKFYCFDVLYIDGKNMLDKSYTKRREVLGKSIKGGKPLQLVDYEITDSAKRISDLMDMELKEGLEGIIVKRADSRYVAGRTGWRWVKMKEAEGSLAKLADTIDCVVLGFTRGKGRRAGFGVGQFLAGVRDKDTIKTITKVGTGITDEEFGELNKRLSNLVIKKKPKEYDVHKDLEPDFWVEPKLVVELAADEITKSPKHTAGFALRFPRLINFRDDKSASQVTTVDEIKKLSQLQ